MIQRRRIGTTSSYDTDKNGGGSTMSKLGDGDDHGHSDQRRHFQPIIPYWLITLIGVGCVGGGILHYRYDQVRGVDVVTSPKKKVSTVQLNNQAFNSKKSMLTAEEDKGLEIDKDTGLRYHLVFSTDCSPYQHWQSYLVYFSAMKVRQPGHVTRIASGCNEEDAAAMKEWFQNDVQFMSSRFHLQLTPHFSGVKDESGQTIADYKFFNKPFGLKYWMENSPQLNWIKDKSGDGYVDGFSATVKDDIVILIDPDMGLIRPLTADFSDDRDTVIAKVRQSHILARKVGHGKPFAQVYGFGTQWFTKVNVTVVAGPNTPAASVSQEEGRLYYPVGPPYLGTVLDMHRIAQKWTEFVPKVYVQYPHLLAEMFAFCIAAAHLQLRFQMIDSLMISAINIGGEGWPLVNKIPPQEVCGFAKNVDNSKYAVPSVVHYCQRYAIGERWFYTKRKIPSDIYDCEVPLFEEPPDDVAVQFNYRHPPHGNKEVYKDPMEATQNAFVLCFLYRLVNEAATFYKQIACPAQNRKMNLAKTRNLAELMTSNTISLRARP